MTTVAKRLRILSLGAGVQSSFLFLAYTFGWLPNPPDYAIFADTQDEPAEVYEWLRWLQSVSHIPIVIVSKGQLWKSATRVKRSRKSGKLYLETAIPVFTVDGLKKGKGQRHCTRDFKINMVQQKTRELLGVKRIGKKSGVLVDMIIGISTDEAHRMKTSPKHWIAHEYPLCNEINYSRQDCEAWYMLFFGVTPPRSACKYCPFRSDEQWQALPKNEFDECVVRERELQAAYAKTEGHLTAMPYFHASRVPLDQVKFTAGGGRNHIGNECEGFCGV